MPERLLEERIGEFAERLSLSPFLHTPVRKLSLGQRMRIELEQPVTEAKWREICGQLPVRWQALEQGRIWQGAFSELEITAATILQPVLNQLTVLDIKLEETPIEEIVADIYQQGGAGA